MNTNQDSGAYSGRSRRSRTDSGGGIVLVLVGLIALAWTQGFINLDLRGILPDFNMERIWPGFNWGLAWPVFLLIPGVLLLGTAAMSVDPRQRTEKLGGGALLVVLSAYFFANMWGLVSGDLWPVLLVVGGVLVLLRSRAAGPSL